jgi:hypothetical protein
MQKTSNKNSKYLQHQHTIPIHILFKSFRVFKSFFISDRSFSKNIQFNAILRCFWTITSNQQNIFQQTNMLLLEYNKTEKNHY